MLSLDELGGQPLRQMTRAEYDRLIDLGFFDQDKHVQLLDGLLVRMTPQGDDHIKVILKLTQLFAVTFQGRALAAPQVPLVVSDSSEPEPDMALLPLSAATKPGKPRKAYLVVEVSGASLKLDRTLKARLYAQARIPEYWIVNLEDQVIEVYRRPRAGRYLDLTTRSRGESVSVGALPGPSFQVDDLLPPR